jgi:starch phosphorylase
MPDSIHFVEGMLPDGLKPLLDLALDLHWTWNHRSDALWRSLDAAVWDRTRNPIFVLQTVGRDRLAAVAGDPAFREELVRLEAARAEYHTRATWFEREHQAPPGLTVAYFSMEYGITDALPLYSGGLGVLAGDHLKTASDLGVPLVAVGLFYREGYFRQMLDNEGRQLELYTQNSTTGLPVSLVLGKDGAPLRIALDLPGRILHLRIWVVRVGRVALYLLDSDDPLNSPFDRGITSKLYGGDGETRFLQELVLGIGGWRALEALGIEPDVCHLNEGHAALVTLERARSLAERERIPFWDALWASRAGNVFTTHTPVAAGFDSFPLELLNKYGRDYGAQLGVDTGSIAALGRLNPRDASEPFNMAYAAARTCARMNGVSALHAAVSRRIFAPLFPRWPEGDVPVEHVTNGVHVPTWDSPAADRLWTRACGKDRWLGSGGDLGGAIATVPDADLWALRGDERRDLVAYARRRLAQQLGQRGADRPAIDAAREALDPNALTIGFARRFTAYKRPNMLLRQPERLLRLLADRSQPVQLIVAGKAHPHDATGKSYVRAWADFVRRPGARDCAVFIEDYDMALAHELVQGVDLWLNTPLRPWEASGTSGMKVLVNGGLNLSELDGWWAEAWDDDVGWALGDGREHDDPEWDDRETEQLFALLERQIVPEFYDRDEQGIPRRWVQRIRTSMSRLTPRFSSNRMLAEYVSRFYLPAAADYRRRREGGARMGSELRRWVHEVRHQWSKVHWGNVRVQQDGDALSIEVQVYLGSIQPEMVRVELFADAKDGLPLERHVMQRTAPLKGAVGGFTYALSFAARRPADHYTPRLVPYHPEALVPQEAEPISWYAR